MRKNYWLVSLLAMAMCVAVGCDDGDDSGDGSSGTGGSASDTDAGSGDGTGDGAGGPNDGTGGTPGGTGGDGAGTGGMAAGGAGGMAAGGAGGSADGEGFMGCPGVVEADVVEGCAEGCQRLVDCAHTDEPEDLCPGYDADNEETKSAILCGCLPECSALQVSAVESQETCADVVNLSKTFSPDDFTPGCEGTAEE